MRKTVSLTFAISFALVALQACGTDDEPESEPACEELSVSECETGRCRVARSAPLPEIDGVYCIEPGVLTMDTQVEQCRDQESETCEGGDAMAYWSAPNGSIWQSRQYCGLEGHVLYSEDIPSCSELTDGAGGAGGGGAGGGGQLDCSELSNEQCLEVSRQDDGPCARVLATELEAATEGNYCLGSELEFCVDVDGPNCSDADADATWVDSDGTLYRTSNSCGPDRFERVDRVSADSDCHE